MTESKDTEAGRGWKCFGWLEPEEKAIDTLTAFINDSEHELIAVITALQANVDLIYEEQRRNHLELDKFTKVNRTIARLTKDTKVLASVAELAKAARSNSKQTLAQLMKEIARDTKAAFASSQVTLNCNIAEGTNLIGQFGALKLMITGMLLAVLHKCKRLDTVTIVGLTSKRKVSLSFDTGIDTGEGVFTPWKLGQLRLTPMNGDGIGLSAVDAMARLHRGQLTVKTMADDRKVYRLLFKV
ncbi:MAG: HAMP domain-containing histidine kinase [Candidatus Melainabacteria bacterium]|nr:HAMP domain-containing histidine kinase [Candidatus Melainabacteria bacterium]